MQKLLLISISLFCLNYNYASSQDMKIKCEDSDGREFSIKVISKEFGWSSIAGDKIRYNRAGWVKEIGPVYLKYNRGGWVKEVGSVYIKYNRAGWVEEVGNLFIKYNLAGQVKETTGTVN